LQNHLFGRFNVYNLAAVLSTLGVLGIPWADACRYVEQLHTVPGRMEFCRSDSGRPTPLVVIDFAHTPDALQQVLQALKEHGFGRICCVFGCGGDRDRGKRALMGQVAESLADQLVLTDDNPRTESADRIIKDILEGIQNRQDVHIQRDRKAAIAWAIEHTDKQDVVLVAGKGDEAYQVVGNSKSPFSDRQVVQSLLQGGMH
jgi:UDP-N-acetylmuramoyl-L-alanyl-D-glutamate--2,6-diaminopimelate ligase